MAPFYKGVLFWEVHCEILDYFFVANGVDEEENKRAVLLSCVGAQTYTLMRNLLNPDKSADRSYSDLVRLMKNHFHPKPSEIMQPMEV